MQNKYHTIHRRRNKLLAVILIGGENGDAVYGRASDSQEHISLVINTIILIMVALWNRADHYIFML